MTPEQRANFVANVTDAEQRRSAEKLWQAAHVAEVALTQACVSRGIAAVRPGEDRTEEDREAEINAAVAADPDLKALHAAAEQALQPWLTCTEYGEPLESYDGEIIRCVLTGFLVHENDKYLIDLGTHECVLKSALGVPLGFILGDFLSDDAPPIAIGDDALSVAQAVAQDRVNV
ncbi:hypothetical protein Hden_1183 [Hyphomicrobium denitrificans ATCC 51888]|uniref:Uncharacterized protein n=1 Tax=Hyphomicrobium denitrificans (strain ATCC 51888 / DSM 1869 / NCIMB 11706 / TK 0415) TaxID=582899 RepID=D8JVV7_HYPDA|nr:hypothetical protein [Hyphomicrobium denitrificans]ADJ22996.1 hypothetical protein Hden_1183 [Hyphomicrobium denitrificans ATCC 51888]